MTEKVEPLRLFETGASRDTLTGKLSYIKALSPIVLRRYVEYIGIHRTLPDGSLRDWDNWKKGIPQEVYLDGLARHFMSVWLILHGFPARDNHGTVTLSDALCGIIFNSQGMLHEVIMEQEHGLEKPEGKIGTPQAVREP